MDLSLQLWTYRYNCGLIVTGVDLSLQVWTYRYSFRVREKSGLIVTLWTYRYRCGLIVTMWTYRYCNDKSIVGVYFWGLKTILAPTVGVLR